MNSIQGFGSMQGMMGMSGPRPNFTLTDDQKQKVSDILSKFDSENLTAEDAQSIFKQLREAGIRPGKGLRDAIEAAGFDAEKVRSLGMPAHPQGVLLEQENGQSGPPRMQGGMGGLQGMGGMMGMGAMQPPPPADLTEDQTNQIKSILSEYDPANVTTEDAQAIFQKFSDAGIQPARGMKEAIEASGFDAEQLREMGMPKDSMQNSMFQISAVNSQGLNISTLQSLQSILSQYDFNNLNSEQQTSLFSKLQSTGLLRSGSLLDLGA